MPEPKRPLKVFLCHAHSDKDAVKALYARLIKDGVDAWLDKEKLLPGQDWELEIRRAVREADVVVVCLSKQFNQAGFRQKEVRLALDTAMEKPEGEIFIIPARLEECDTLESLRKWHWVDLFEDDGYEILIRAFRARADKIGATLQIKRSKSPKVKTQNGKTVLEKNNRKKSSQELRMFYDLAAHYECDIENTNAETLASFLLESLTRIMRIVPVINKSDDNRTIEYRTDQVEYFDPKEGKTLQYALIVHGKKLQLVGKGKFRGVESLTTVSEMLIITVTQSINGSRLRFDSNNIPAEQFKELVQEVLLDFGKDISSEVKDSLFEQLSVLEQTKPEIKTNPVVEEEKQTPVLSREQKQPKAVDEIIYRPEFEKNSSSPLLERIKKQLDLLRSSQYKRTTQKSITSTVAIGEFLVQRGQPNHSSIVAEFISRMSEGSRNVTSDDLVIELGAKAYVLLQLDGKLVGLASWYVENLVSCTTDIFLEGHLNLYKALSVLIKEVERSSNELQCEISLVFPTNALATREDLWEKLNYEHRTPEMLGVQAWQDSARELITSNGKLFFKMLRPDRVTRPI